MFIFAGIRRTLTKLDLAFDYLESRPSIESRRSLKLFEGIRVYTSDQKEIGNEEFLKALKAFDEYLPYTSDGESVTKELYMPSDGFSLKVIPENKSYSLKGVIFKVSYICEEIIAPWIPKKYSDVVDGTDISQLATASVEKDGIESNLTVINIGDGNIRYVTTEHVDIKTVVTRKNNV